MIMEKYLKELLISQLKQRLGKLQQELQPLQQPPPDLKVISYGLLIGYIDITTEKEITPDRINKWKELISTGSKMTIVIPKEEKIRITEILWREGLAEKVSVGTYEINLFLP